jgi:membrane-bound metal-dependent hydrolase YbcI (DUF457 family)
LEPVTHALTSFAIARGIQSRLPRFGTGLLIASGVAPDLDYAGYFAGPGAFLALHRTALHSIIGAAALSGVLGGLFCTLGKKWAPAKNTRKQAPPLTFASALGLCALGLIMHDLLDLASGEGIQLLWPFRPHWSHWNLAESFDPWVLALLVAGLLIPQLFRLVNEEVGARKNSAGSGAAALTLLLLVAFFGARSYFHGRAIGLLLSSEYHGREPLSAGAFPSSANPLDWRGIVSTDNTLEEIDVNLASAEDFSPDRSLTRYKPPDSPQLEAAQNTSAARSFLRYAQFPLASAAHREQGYRIELRDLRFPAGDESAANMIVRVELSGSFRVTLEKLLYASSAN